MSQSATTLDPRLETLQATIEAAQQGLVAKQDAQGWWNGEDEANQTLDAQYIFLFHYCGILDRPELQDKARRLGNWLRRTQREDGTWAIYYGAPGCISVTTEAYFALKMLGDDPDAPHMVKAREFVLAQGGPAQTRMLTRFMLALLGELPWSCCPSLPIQMMFAPTWTPFRFNIYELSYWARVCTVPLAILADQKKVVPVPEGQGISELYPAPPTGQELYDVGPVKTVSWSNLFLQSDRFLKWAERNNISPFRKAALERAKTWILEHQDDAGDWGGIFPAICNSMMALYTLGMSTDDEVFKRGMAALDRFEWPDEEKDETHIAPCVSPVWDTAWTALALAESGLPSDGPVLTKASDWLRSMQIKREGDWAVKAKKGTPAGGWAFQFYNDFYPDTDDSAVVMMAMTNGSPESSGERELSIDLGRRWLCGLQNRDGGWGAFELEVDNVRFDEILYNDEKNMLDPSTVDVTGRILEMFGVLGVSREDPVVKAAEAYVRRDQEADGKWWGRWGVNYVYGTWSVVRGLAAIGVTPEDPAMIKAADWLEAYQQEDGGYGESCASYIPGREAETCAPTPSQTAWGLMGLVSCGRASSEAARRAADWLVEHQRESDGLWYEEEFTGTGFPEAFYLRYHYYPLYFPLLALSAYRNALAS